VDRSSFRHRAPRTRSVVLATAILAVGISPFAVAATGDALREGVRNGTTNRETEIVSNIAAGSGAKGGYATRQSNLSASGGGAIYGCRSGAGGTPSNQLPCIRANNLAAGRAFEFNAQNGLSAARSPSATAATRASRSPRTPRRGRRPERRPRRRARRRAGRQHARAKENLDADTVDGLTRTQLQTRWALVNEAGGSRSSPAASRSRASAPTPTSTSTRARRWSARA
jgi:hypothetical protein